VVASAILFFFFLVFFCDFKKCVPFLPPSLSPFRISCSTFPLPASTSPVFRGKHSFFYSFGKRRRPLEFFFFSVLFFSASIFSLPSLLSWVLFFFFCPFWLDLLVGSLAGLYAEIDLLDSPKVQGHLILSLVFLRLGFTPPFLKLPALCAASVFFLPLFYGLGLVPW